jgi:hypothetical protein
MEIKVYDRNKGKQGLISAIASVYAKELKLHRSRSLVSINTVPGLLKNTGMRGGITQVSKHELSIAIDSRLDLETMVIVLAHEMVHAKQYAFGQLRVGENGYIWLGFEYETSYYESPWEIEAFSRERVLANKIAAMFA